MKLTQPRLKEADITRAIRNYLRFKRIFHFKVWQGMGSQPGIADIVGIYNGRFLAIEVKTARGHLSDKQEAFLTEVQANGGIAFVARSVQDVINNLQQQKDLS